MADPRLGEVNAEVYWRGQYKHSYSLRDQHYRYVLLRNYTSAVKLLRLMMLYRPHHTTLRRGEDVRPVPRLLTPHAERNRRKYLSASNAFYLGLY